jgi:RNA polymerase sigma factor (TIGR02999 family)
MAPSPHRDATQLLLKASEGDESAVSSLFSVVYDELRRIAAGALRHERHDHTLQPTALVHEAYLRLADEPGAWRENRAHFLAIASRAMRRVLVEHARRRKAIKRGSGRPRLSIEDAEPAAPAYVEALDLVLLDDALERLSALDARQGRIVELRFFGGLTVEEIATVLGLSSRTVKREWQISRAWLKREIGHLAPAAD